MRYSTGHNFSAENQRNDKSLSHTTNFRGFGFGQLALQSLNPLNIIDNLARRYVRNNRRNPYRTTKQNYLQPDFDTNFDSYASFHLYAKSHSNVFALSNEQKLFNIHFNLFSRLPINQPNFVPPQPNYNFGHHPWYPPPAEVPPIHINLPQKWNHEPPYQTLSAPVNQQQIVNIHEPFKSKMPPRENYQVS